MDALALRVDRIHEELRPNARGELVPVRVVTYFVGEHGPFQLRAAVEGYDAASVRAQLEAAADQVRRTFG